VSPLSPVARPREERITVQIDFYYWADCPSHDEALARLRAVMAEQGLHDEVRIVEVRSDEEAQALRFPGSPTIRVDGVDIDAAGAAQQDFSLTCRVYRRADGRITPLPPRELIAAALRAAADRQTP
jgi:hypothetical protein